MENKLKPKMPDRFHFKSEEELKAALKKSCSPKCNKCLGRGHTGWDILKKFWRVCQCVDTRLLKLISEELRKNDRD